VHAEVMLRVPEGPPGAVSRLLGQFGFIRRLHAFRLVDTHTNLHKVEESTFLFES
jgi:hypothetical protein